MSTSYFHEELVTEILNRLPPKSLFRFRCVCKIWRNLIGNPDLFGPNNPFNQIRSILREPNSPPLLLVKAKHGPDDLKHMFYFLSHDTLKCQAKITLEDLGGCLQHLKLVASCNGLLCLRDRSLRYIYLWNPATSEGLNSLPPHAQMNFYMMNSSSFDPTRCPVSVSPDAVGFGFDRRSNDFKVLSIYDFVDRKGRSKRRAEVFRLSTRTWRRLDIFVPFDEKIYYNYFPTTASDGFFFWWVVLCESANKFRPNTEYDNEKIVAFDFNEEVFRTTPLPDGFHYNDFYSVNFTVFNGFVAIIGFPKERLITGALGYRLWERTSRSLGIWVLFEFGVKDSWTKLIDIPLSLDFPEKPLGLWGNALFMQNAEGKLVLYDLLSHSEKDVLQFHRNRVGGDKIEDDDEILNLDVDGDNLVLQVFPYVYSSLINLSLELSKHTHHLHYNLEVHEECRQEILLSAWLFGHARELVYM
ncbi:F-box/kelch-repeat protein At3g23880-like [Corylus avellana]|uniref:F-box/kelch-repeat protein At3g23880-like n=1 Tax=Corylus avellana TaxID=13451 RepID=UPI001E20425A|nr:F-box/kelch-repeat protein At3g23880-like isoform X2 [Corylus avellana]XP_059434644.1 F-box/kelch-repeat protein At3g23880-like [Corylus avellana]